MDTENKIKELIEALENNLKSAEDCYNDALKDGTDKQIKFFHGEVVGAYNALFIVKTIFEVEE